MNAIEKLTIKLAEIMVRDFLGQPEQGEVDAYLHAARQAPQAAADPPEWPAELASNCIYNNCPHPKHCREQNRCTATEKHHDKPDGAPELAAKHAADDRRTQEIAAEMVAAALDIPISQGRRILALSCAWPDGRWYRAGRMMVAKSADAVPVSDGVRERAREIAGRLPHAQTYRQATSDACSLIRELAQ